MKYKYKHYKGNIYTLLLDGVKNCDNPNILYVIYQSEANGDIWCRERTEFYSTLPDGRRRFAPIEETTN